MTVGDQARDVCCSVSLVLELSRDQQDVTTRREAPSVYYSLTSEQIAELLAVARRILSTVLSDQLELLGNP